MSETPLEPLQLLEKYLRGSHILSLATSFQNRPSNRDMYYIVPRKFTDTIYVTTPANAQKLLEIEANPYVAFATEPTLEDQGVVTSNTATVELTDMKINDVMHLIEAQIPEWEERVGRGRDNFAILAITFPTVKIFGNQGIEAITL
ncbi:MAG: pyridoxamine 5'-phosphate oxidase family protein [Lactobacillaceae bacterium]|jgi:general stress protein 26|nr:pyridoxamine 5'-phosphate oxidase family protein [Lactobacillaceae bacterium]